MRIFIICLFTIVTLTSLNVCYGQSQGILKGYIIDKVDNQKIINANIIIINTAWGGVTNQKGYFELAIPEGKYLVEARMIGYKPDSKVIIIEAAEETGIVFELQPEAVLMDSVEVVSARYEENTYAKSYELLPGQLKNLPQVGEADPLRVLFSLPGVNSINDFSNQLFIMGGNFDESLITVDNVPVYNPYHLGGIFSSVNADIIGKEKVYLSNYPVNVGGYLSGAVQLETKNVMPDILRTSASFGLISSKANIQGPLGKGTFLASARRTYLDFVADILMEDFPYYFYDGYAKYTLPADENNLLQFSILYSKDVYQLFSGIEDKIEKVKEHPNWGNLLINSKYTHLFSKGNSIDLTLYLSNTWVDANTTLIDLINDNVYIDYGIRDITFNLNYKSAPGKNKYETGIEIKKTDVLYDWYIGYDRDLRNLINPPEEIFLDYAANPYENSAKSILASAWFNYNLNLSEYLGVHLGFRGSYMSLAKAFYPSPFLSMNYKLNDNTSINFNYGRYYQFMYTVKERKNEGIYAPFSAYFLPGSKDETGTADNFLFGFNTSNLWEEFSFEADVYYKIRQNLAASYNEDPRYRFENGYAAGFDISLEKKEGWLTGRASYSFSRTVKHGQKYSYYAGYDRTHSLKILFDFELTEKWHFSAFWTYASGLPYTEIIGKTAGGKDHKDDSGIHFYAGSPGLEWRPVEGTKNGSRMKPVHRLDLGLTGSFVWGNWLLKPYFQVLNVYSNPNYYYYNVDLYEGKDDVKYWGTYVIPSIGVTIDF